MNPVPEPSATVRDEILRIHNPLMEVDELRTPREYAGRFNRH